MKFLKFRPRRKLLRAVALAVTTITAARAGAQCHNVFKKFSNPSSASDDWFGASLAISEEYVLVSAPLDDIGATDAGSAFLFDVATGSLLQTLTNPTPARVEWLDGEVAISGDNIIIGAPHEGAGSVHIFSAASGALVRTINNPMPTGADFGWSVAIWGNNLLVGAPYNDIGANDAGSAYLYDAVTGSLMRTFSNPAAEASEHFGYSVAISESYVVIGKPNDYAGAINTGKVYLFNATTGLLLWTFSYPATSPDGFGWSVAISGNNLLIGAYEDDTAAYGAGRVFMFDAATRGLRRIFESPAPAEEDWFGVSVAMSGNNVLIGAPGEGTGTGNLTGSAYLFDATSGALLEMFNNPTPGMDDRFGGAVAIAGNNILVGAVYDETDGVLYAGSAYLFSDNVRSAIHCYLLNGGDFSSELDVNADGAIDIADLIAAP